MRNVVLGFVLGSVMTGGMVLAWGNDPYNDMSNQAIQRNQQRALEDQAMYQQRQYQQQRNNPC